MTSTLPFPTLRSRLLLTCLAGLCLILWFLTPAMAAPSPIKLLLNVQKEQRTTAADGTTTVSLVPVASVVPGDRLVYVLSYVNTGQQAINDVVLDYPLPAGVVYRSAAEGSLAPQVSTDGAYFGPLSQATAAVKALRWVVPGNLPPGGKGEVVFKATLN